MTSPTTDTSESTFAIGGMTCASCASKIERALGDLPGARTAEVNFATRRAHIEWDDGACDLEAAADTVTGLGYTPSISVGGDGSMEGHNHMGHEMGHDHDHDGEASLIPRLIVAVACFIPLMVMSMGPWQIDRANWIALALATPAVLWAGWPIHRKAIADVRHRSLGMDTLISLGAMVSYLWSVWITVSTPVASGEHAMHMSLTESGGSDVYFESAAGIIAFVLIGRVLEARARGKASAALHLLADLSVKEVELESGVSIPLETLAVGDRFIARPGDRIATDGTIVEGTSAVDASMVTGEPVPVDVSPGSSVVGGTVNVAGRIVVEATAVGSETMLARISEMVANAQHGKPQLARLADRVSRVFVPVVIVLSAVVFLAWWFATGDAARAVAVAVSVIVIACPCALGLATPIAIMVGTGRAARDGILFRNAETLERAERIDTFLFDKTGTLTTGIMGVEAVVPAPNISERDLLAAAASVESASQHPIGQAIVSYARNRLVRVQVPEESTAEHGAGIEAVIDGRHIRVGRRAYVSDDTHELGDVVAALTSGATVVYCSIDGQLAGAVVLRDAIRPEAITAVAEVHALGARTVIVTGDGRASAEHVAALVGIDSVHAEVYPAEKLAEVERERAGGARVAVIGDGVNDAPALAAADVGIAIGTGADIALETADISLVRGDITGAPRAVGIARATMRNIRQNLVWAFGYNVLAIPIAASGKLNAGIAAAAMAASDVCVVLNALRLWKWRPATVASAVANEAATETAKTSRVAEGAHH